MQNFFAHEAVELLAHAVQPLGGIAGVQPRCLQRFALFEALLTRKIQRFGLHQTATVDFDVSTQTVVTAPAQVDPPDFALFFAKALMTDHHRREIFGGGFAATVFLNDAAVIELRAVWLELFDPAAMKRHHFGGAFWQRQRYGKARELISAGFEIGQGIAGLQHTAVIEAQFAAKLQAGDRILGSDRQLVSLMADIHGVEHRRPVQTVTMTFNARCTERPASGVSAEI